ncbi:hypothetical protein [Nostoc sp. C052]|uniref:hypothetical protein n=1 Tax=Nostoc sp. C052 TaxID=2576902 RepID=UPI0015C3AD2A|nr:hypothetical protein [Nostoc sp. C052]
MLQTTNFPSQVISSPQRIEQKMHIMLLYEQALFPQNCDWQAIDIYGLDSELG